jgi:hypothetical protein
LPVQNQQRLSAESLEAVGKTLGSLRTSLFLENDVLIVCYVLGASSEFVS